MAGAAADVALARAAALEQRGELQAAYETLSRVLAAEPAHPEANHRLGLLLHQGAGRHAEAAGFLERAVRADPDNAIYRSNLGVVLKETGQLEAAVAAYEAALRLAPELAATRSNLGVALLGLGRVEAAIAAQRAAIATRPGYPEAHANLGLALLAGGDVEGAIASYRRAVSLRPDYANAHQYLAVALGRLGRLSEAEASARRAIALRPGQAANHHALAAILVAAGRLGEAAASYRAAVDLAPEAAAWRGLGDALNGLGEHREAAAAFRAGLVLDAADAALHGGLGLALSEMGGMPRALESYRRALALDPGNARYRLGVAATALAVGLLDEAAAAYAAISEGAPEHRQALDGLVFVSNYLPELPPAETTRRARRYGEGLEASVVPCSRHANVPDSERRLRVGLVSGDLCRHPVAAFLEGVLGAIDGREIELFAYATRALADETTARLRCSVPNWCEAARLSDDALEARIRADGIDILVDLSGHTHGARLAVFARRPAPVAVTWLGYSGTTGLSHIDYVLADRVVAPPAEAGLYSEAVWRLPHSYLCYTPPAGVGAVSLLPALAKGHVTFGSFNNLNKVNDRTLALWGRVLAAVPAARLAIKGTALRRSEAAAELAARFVRLGLPSERVDLLGYEAAEADHLAAYRQVDIGLDPFPYNGTTTTCEALLMGVPVLTLRGDRFIAHVGESLLATVGLDDWVAADADDFVRRAVAFAADRQRLAALRAGLRERLLASPLCDAPRFARDLGAAWRGMWRIWCRAQAGGEGAGPADRTRFADPPDA